MTFAAQSLRAGAGVVAGLATRRAALLEPAAAASGEGSLRDDGLRAAPDVMAGAPTPGTAVSRGGSIGALLATVR